MGKRIKKLYSGFLRKREEVIRKLFGHRGYRKFVIVSDSRTGSTLLMSLLNSHPNIIAEGELFKTLNGSTCEQIWRNFFSYQRKIIKWAGFKLFYFHPRDPGDQSVWDFIEDDNEIVIIHLTRENILRSYASKQIGLKTRLWTENINRPNLIRKENKLISLSMEECIEHFEYIKACIEKANERFRNHFVIPVEYENLKNNKQREMNRIFSALDLPIYSVQTEMKRQNPEPLEELIENYGELKEGFKGSKWEYLFK